MRPKRSHKDSQYELNQFTAQAVVECNRDWPWRLVEPRDEVDAHLATEKVFAGEVKRGAVSLQTPRKI